MADRPWLRIFAGFCGYECGAHGLSRHSHATAEVTRPTFRVFRGCKRLVVFAFSAFFAVNRIGIDLLFPALRPWWLRVNSCLSPPSLHFGAFSKLFDTMEINI